MKKIFTDSYCNKKLVWISIILAVLLTGCSGRRELFPDPVVYYGQEDIGENACSGLDASDAVSEDNNYAEEPSIVSFPDAKDLPELEDDLSANFDDSIPVTVSVIEEVSENPVNTQFRNESEDQPVSTPVPEKENESQSANRKTSAENGNRSEKQTPRPADTAETVTLTPTSNPVSPAPEISPGPTAPFDGTFTDPEIELAARVAFFEAGNEDGRKAVLSVLYNRCMSTKFGGKMTSISTEVYRKSQFSVINNENFLTVSIPNSLISAAETVFRDGNTSLPDNVLFFRVASNGTEWGDKTYYDTIGGNAFFSA